MSVGTAPPGSARFGGRSEAAEVLDAVLAISSDLDLRQVLIRIAQAAADLTAARCTALGVIGSDGNPAEFVVFGADEATGTRIGSTPQGPGLLCVPIRIRGTVFGNLYLTDKAGGGSFDADDEALVQALANAAGLVIENARSFWFSERRRHWLEASADLARAVEPPMPLEESLTLTAERARLAAGAQVAAIVQFPEGSYPVIAAADASPGIDPVQVVRAVVSEARWVGQQLVAVNVPFGERHALLVPLRAHLSDPGALVVVIDDVDSSELFDEQEFLSEFADQAALAVDRAQAVIDLEDLAVLADRERIARDLHDHVIQRLFAIGLKLGGTESVGAGPRRDAIISEAVDELDLTIRDIRTTIFGLTRSPDDLSGSA